MGRFGGAFAVVVAGVCLAGCSTLVAGVASPAVVTPVAASPTTAKPATSSAKPPPFTPPASPAKITAACPFLGPAELQELLQTSEDLMATEQPPDRTYVEGTEFQCRYEGKYVHPWLLDLWIIAAADSYRPAKALENYKKDCSGPATAVSGAGEGAYFCDRTGTDDVEMVITGKRSQGQNRLAIAYVVKHRSDVYTRLATTLAARL
ncbi:hypothetical protein AB0J55_14200 [Amycolatopsis sp. NPDC049688]|uniref:hypothetical protein n=1 Tax=Amycolatopsis sp. NPDC049688 TaxID=3154733 RepID=UPI0034398F04